MEKRHSSIASLQSSLLSPENQEAVNELAEKLQTDGLKVVVTILVVVRLRAMQSPFSQLLSVYIANWP